MKLNILSCLFGGIFCKLFDWFKNMTFIDKIAFDQRQWIKDSRGNQKFQ